MLIFDKSVCGRRAVTLPALDVPEYNLDENFLRNAELDLPEVAEIDLVRHYIGLSLKAKGVDNVFYPLGSCTMKYNPKLNEVLARNPAFTSVHPLQPASTVQGSLEVMYDAAKSLAEITGMDEISLEPAAGAHGEYTSLQGIRKYHLSRGDSKRNKIIVPDSAHGTNPASAAMCGFEIINVKSDKRGNVDLKALKEAVGEDTAALMLTNPNTLGLLDEHILKITSIVHKAGGLVYYDGANLNAVMGVIRRSRLGRNRLQEKTCEILAKPDRRRKTRQIFLQGQPRQHRESQSVLRQLPCRFARVCVYPYSWQGGHQGSVRKCRAQCKLPARSDCAVLQDGFRQNLHARICIKP
ncbi:MAG: hypothetical protein BHV97_03690 [Clostridium sp. CAG:349_48_7]|nr:MAG: hypothetical protein BHV97_03690 [Clostridium sp. CAG:349_48_7]